MKYIKVETTLGYEVYINVEYIESVLSIDRETRIFTMRGDDMFPTYESVNEIMRRIEEKQT